MFLQLAWLGATSFNQAKHLPRNLEFVSKINVRFFGARSMRAASKKKFLFRWSKSWTIVEKADWKVCA